jgi:anti-anti-sigma factor
VRLSVSGELDIATAPQLDHALAGAQADAALVILDLRELQFMDSSGANLIAAASGRARQARGRLLVVRGPVQVEQIFALVGLDRQLELLDHPPAAPSAPVLDGVPPVTFASLCVTEIPSIVLEGEIDPGTVIALQRRIVEALNAGQRRVVVDLSAVTVLGGATSDLLCGALRRLTRRGATLAIAGGPPRVHRVLELCAIDGVELHQSVSAARPAALATPRGAPPLPPSMSNK